MFGLLKKKISEFIGKLTDREEKKEERFPERNLAILPVQPVEPGRSKEGASNLSVRLEEKPGIKPGPEEAPESFQPSPKQGVEKPDPPILPTDHVTSKNQPAFSFGPGLSVGERTPSKQAEKPSATFSDPQKPVPLKMLSQPPVFAPAEKKHYLPPASPTKPPAQAHRSEPQVPAFSEIPAPDPEPKGERRLEPKIGLLSRLKSVFTNDVQIQEKEIAPLLDDLHWAMLESDVSLDTAEHISDRLKKDLVGQVIQKDQIQAKVRQAVRDVLRETLSGQTFDLVEYVNLHEKPVKILFLGPNGAGKTTTIAKVAHFLRCQGKSVVLAAGDTFRAAAIEQLSHHAKALGVKIVKHQYAADPAAVAFDAIAHAQAHHVDVVLIDTAGRQETNFNLIKEMEKINRVVRPDLKLFVGEAIAGHSLVEQAKSFHQSLQLDGVVLTKLDCDAKGGTSFSLAHEVKVPIVFMGVGQEYSDLRLFDADWIVDNVLAE